MAQPPILHDYYYGNEAEQYTFYRLPKVLFTDSRYKNLSDGAKSFTASCLTVWACP